mmetsp:Transcript_98257/g.225543  ORF Transcript_98257/g.225543 Transcript_98257/m.225543 type:complete len:350 (-) Transcript_98257:748-1797(-)
MILPAQLRCGMRCQSTFLPSPSRMHWCGRRDAQDLESEYAPRRERTPAHYRLRVPGFVGQPCSSSRVQNPVLQLPNKYGCRDWQCQCRNRSLLTRRSRRAQQWTRRVTTGTDPWVTLRWGHFAHSGTSRDYYPETSSDPGKGPVPEFAPTTNAHSAASVRQGAALRWGPPWEPRGLAFRLPLRRQRAPEGGSASWYWPPLLLQPPVPLKLSLSHDPLPRLGPQKNKPGHPGPLFELSDSPLPPDFQELLGRVLSGAPRSQPPAPGWPPLPPGPALPREPPVSSGPALPREPPLLGVAGSPPPWESQQRLGRVLSGTPRPPAEPKTGAVRWTLALGSPSDEAGHSRGRDC